MAELKAAWLAKAYARYVDWLWTDGFGYTTAWATRFSEMVLWYSVAGSAFLNEQVADGFVAKARSGDQLPDRRRPTLIAARELAREVCLQRRTNPVDWFTGGCGNMEKEAWRRLDDIPEIGAKIASFILRDLSLMRDYSKGLGRRAVVYRQNMDRRWFDSLLRREQGLFIPVDVYVFEGARRHKASSTCLMYPDVAPIQADPELHLRAAEEIVVWSRKRGFDPRDVDIYWYLLGAEDIAEDGSGLDK